MNIQQFKQIIKARQKARQLRHARRLSLAQALQSLRERGAI
jgi:hypothetical protein